MTELYFSVMLIFSILYVIFGIKFMSLICICIVSAFFFIMWANHIYENDFISKGNLNSHLI